MLGRIRKALAAVGGQGAAASAAELAPPLESVMPAIAPQELVSRFEEELAAVGAKHYRASTLPELDDILRGILNSAQARAVVISRNALLARLGFHEKILAWGTNAATWGSNGDNESSFRAACFTAEVGITGVDFALAETGSLVLASLTEGSQLASLAPPVHVALYRREQVKASLDEILAGLPVSRDSKKPSPGRSVVFVTGTSRTADIEQILVRGVHGPRELHAILIEEACLGGTGRQAPRGEAP